MSPVFANSNFIFLFGSKLYRITNLLDGSPFSKSPKSISSIEKAAIDPNSLRFALHFGKS